MNGDIGNWFGVGCGLLTVTVATRIITFLVGDPYKPSYLCYCEGAISKFGGKKNQGLCIFHSSKFYFFHQGVRYMAATKTTG